MIEFSIKDVQRPLLLPPCVSLETKSILEAQERKGGIMGQKAVDRSYFGELLLANSTLTTQKL